MGVTAGSEDAVDGGDTVAATSIAEVEPVNGASTIRTSAGRGRGLDTSDLLAKEQLLGLGEVKGGNTVGVEVVVAGEGDLPVAVELKGGVLGEGVGGGGSDAVSVEVEGDFVTGESSGSESCPLLLREGDTALAGVEVSYVVEHGESTGGGGVGAISLAGVVLDTEAKGDVLEGSTLGRRLKLFSTSRRKNWFRPRGSAAGARTIPNRVSQSQSG